MSREAHVRSCERLVGKFRRPTLLRCGMACVEAFIPSLRAYLPCLFPCEGSGAVPSPAV